MDCVSTVILLGNYKKMQMKGFTDIELYITTIDYNLW